MLKETGYRKLFINSKEEFNSIHFSLLVLQPWTRNLNFNPKYEYRRKYVRVKWYRLEEAFQKIKTNLPSATTDCIEKEKTDYE